MVGLVRFERGQWNAVAIAAAVLLAFSFVFGGASRQHELRLALVELAALPLLVLAAQAHIQKGRGQITPLALAILGALVALPLLQLLPLPPGLWTGLPGREQSVLALDIAGLTPGWTSLSLTPDKTWRSLLALFPPVAMFLAVLVSPKEGRLNLAVLLLGAALLSLVLGAAQLASGGSQLYPWRTTDSGNVVGFFANRNHFATLCLISLPFAAAMGARSVRRGRTDQGRMTLWLSALYIALVIVILGVTRSRMGIILSGPTLLAGLGVAWIAAGRGRPRPLLLGVAACATAAFVAVSVFALGPILQRFDTDGVKEGRFENWPTIAEAANAYLPLGSGLGSFDAVYRSVEPLDRLDATYFNQAHNEYLETWLEAGWPGVILLGVFLVWFSRRAWTAWRKSASTDRDLQRAASVAIGVVLLHSVVDYPLRTETIAVVFALCCGLLELAARTDAALDAGKSPSRRRR